MMSKWNVIDLFCGAGGLSYGFEKAGFNILLGVDNDAMALKTFEQNHNGSKSICGDITSITYKDDIAPILDGKTIDVNYEIAKLMYEAKANPNNYKPSMTVGEAKAILQSLTPWEIIWT